MPERDIIIVNAGLRCWGVERNKLFAALQQLGWHQEGNHWYAPERKPGEPSAGTVRAIYEAAPPVAGMTMEELDNVFTTRGEPDQWRDRFGHYPELRIAPDLGRGVWLFCAPCAAPLEH